MRNTGAVQLQRDGESGDDGAHLGEAAEAIWKATERHIRALLDAGDLEGVERVQQHFERLASARCAV